MDQRQGSAAPWRHSTLGAGSPTLKFQDGGTRKRGTIRDSAWTAPHLLSVPVLPFSSGFLVRDDEGHTGCGCAQQRPPRRLETERSLLQRRLPSRRQHHHPPTHIRRRTDREPAALQRDPECTICCPQCGRGGVSCPSVCQGREGCGLMHRGLVDSRRPSRWRLTTCRSTSLPRA